MPHKHTSKCGHKPIPKFSKQIGTGADGVAYTLDSHKDRIIKIGNYPCINFSGYAAETVEKNFKYMRAHKPAAYVRVYTYKFINCKHCHVSYYCVMDKLHKHAQSDSLSFLASEIQWIYKNRNGNDSFPLEKIIKYANDFVTWIPGHWDNTNGVHVNGQRGIPSEQKKSVMKFLRAIWSSRVFHCDLHSGNIMKDKDGNIKLIDLDRLDLPKAKKLVKKFAPIRADLPKKKAIRPRGAHKK